MLLKNGEINVLLNFNSLLSISFSLTGFFILILPISD